MLWFNKNQNISISPVQSLIRVWLFVTPWTAARQASLSITNSWSSLKLMSIESVMPSIHLILCWLCGSQETGKFGKRWEPQTTWPASWETCMQVRKQQLELDMEQQLFQIGKGVHQGCILSSCLFNFYAEYIMRNAGLEEAQAGIKIAGRNIGIVIYIFHFI